MALSQLKGSEVKITPNERENKYKVGDYVYIEQSQSDPFVIRRIEELQKTAQGNVAAKVVNFYRGRDIPNSLTHLADKHANDLAEEMNVDATFSEVEKHQLRHRELFRSGQIETVNASLIRGKCSVRILSEAEDLRDYMNDKDVFFYTLIYDPTQKTLLADKGEIRLGKNYQCENIPSLLADPKSDPKFEEDLEEQVWEPNKISAEQIERFICLSRSVGTFARALDKPSTIKLGLVDAASLASRDCTLLSAYRTIHEANYDFTKACEALTPNTSSKPGEVNVGPKFFRDEFEDWSKSEVQLFEEGNQKFQKEFNAIRDNLLPWKELPSIIEFYYMWKTSDRCVDQKKRKMTEKEQKLKNVFIPPYNKPSKLCLKENEMPEKLLNRPCEGCCTYESASWYPWGPERYNCRLCGICWSYWKKYGGLQLPHTTRKNILSRDGKTFRNSPMNPKAISDKKHGAKARQPGFYLKTTILTKLMRRVCKDQLPRRSGALSPFKNLEIDGIKEICQKRLAEKPKAGEMRKRNFEKINSVLPRLHKAINSNVYDKKDVQYKPTQRKRFNSKGEECPDFFMKAHSSLRKLREDLSCDIKRFARRPNILIRTTDRAGSGGPSGPNRSEPIEAMDTSEN